jgi:EmrB/QacA subfamily drug resistance transporter
MSTPATLPGVRPDAAARHRPGAILSIILACQLMIVVDATIVTIALPNIQRELGFSPAGLSWVQSAYMLAFGGLLLLGGRAGDLFGRRRVFVGGILLFTFASLLCGLAGAGWWLIAARALQGVGAAFAGPSTLALIATNFAEGPARNRALALFSTMSGAGASVGLILGGMLTSWASWPWVFFVNLPVGLAVAVAAPRLITEPARGTGRVDVAGAVTGTAGMTLLVYGFIRAAADGWSDRFTVLSFVGAVLLLGAFLAIQRRAAQPIMPLHLFADRNRSSAYLTMLLLVVSMFGVFFLLTQFLQDVLGFTPLAAGFAFLPMTLGVFGMAQIVPRLLTRYGPKPLVLTGGLLGTAGMAWLTGVTSSTGYVSGLLGPMVLLGIGLGCCVVPLTVTVLSSVPPHESGVASGIQQTMQWVGGSLGLAILVSSADLTHGLAGGAGNAFTLAVIFMGCALVVALLGIRPVKKQR